MSVPDCRYLTACIGEMPQGRAHRITAYHYIIRSTRAVLLFFAAKEGGNFNISACIFAVCSPTVARHRAMHGGI